MIESIASIFTNYMTLLGDWLNNVSGGNQFLAGAIFVALSGSIALLRKVPGKLFNYIVYRTTTSISLKSYSVSQNGMGEIRNITRILDWFTYTWWYRFVRNAEYISDIYSRISKRRRTVLMGAGRYPFIYKWRLYFLSVTISKEDKTSSTTKTVDLKISTVFGGRKHIIDLMEDILSIYKEDCVFLIDANGDGNFHQNTLSNSTSHFRSKQRYYQDDGSVEFIKKRIETFIEMKPFYNEFNIPYRESFMLHGLPGTGKTSLIRSLSIEYGFDIVNFKVSSIGKSFKEDIGIHIKGGKPIIVLIEDIDSLNASNRRDVHGTGEGEKEILANLIKQTVGINNSEFLNSLDGLQPLENIIFIFTTNYIENIDSAILRKGRINNIVEIKPLGFKGINKFIKERYDVYDHVTDKDVFIPICDLQYMFSSNMKDFKGFSEDLNKYIESKKKG